MNAFEKIADRFFVISTALLFLQAPLFMTQYQQQLTARAAELEWQVNEMENAAHLNGKTLKAYIIKFETNHDPDFSAQGGVMRKVHVRWIKMKKALAALQNSIPLTKPFKFIFYLQWEIVKAALHSFAPGIIFSLEGALWMVVGGFLGMFLFRFLSNITKKVFDY